MYQTVLGINGHGGSESAGYRAVHVAREDTVVVFTVHLRTRSSRQGTHKILPVERERQACVIKVRESSVYPCPSYSHSWGSTLSLRYQDSLPHNMALLEPA